MRIPVHRIPRASNKARGRSEAVVVGFASVDDDMAALADEFWTISKDGYAKTYRRGVMLFMHHVVVGRQAGVEVSHLNAEKLDNRRENLRHATRSENVLNVADGARSTNRSSGLRGVTRDDLSRSLARPWRGKITVRGKTYQTARYATPEEAAEALRDLRASLGQ